MDSDNRAYFSNQSSYSFDNNINDNDDEDDDHDHDSELESRLYAEIYYSNNIIGDNDNLDNSESINPASESNEIQSDLTKDNTNKQNIDKNMSNTSNDSSHLSKDNNKKQFYNLSNSLQSCSSNNTKESKTNSRKKNASSEKNISNKRELINHNDPEEVNNLNTKRKKKENENGNENITNENNRIVNPYNKHIAPKWQGLLSPEFLKLILKKKSKPKKKRKNNMEKGTDNIIDNKISKKNDGQVSEENVISTNTTTEKLISDQKQQHEETVDISDNKNHNTENTENEVETNINKNTSSIIDISSESSKDSSEDISKCDTIVTTEKKLEKQNVVKDTHFSDSMSDSDESIFEVPVPPKPAPPVIDLKDSDNENNNENEGDNNSSSDDSSNAQINLTQDFNKKSKKNITSEEITVYNIDSDSEDQDNFVFNCTEIQKGASSLDEIKKMSSEAQSAKKYAEEVNSTVQNNNVQNKNKKSTDISTNISSIIASKEKVAGISKNNKQNKSCLKQNVSLEDYFFQPMTEKMKSFYNKSWGGENFDMDQLKNKMSSDPRKWAILDDDIMPTFSKRKRYFGMVCSRCQKEGHRHNQCPEPFKSPTCHMCGTTGHFETSCPHKKCLTCGQRQSMYRKTCGNCERMYCSRCNSRGHTEDSCPDLWRRYHHTIKENLGNIPKDTKKVMKPHHQLFCCNCAKKGHDYTSCRKYRWSTHFPTPSYVTSYEGPVYLTESVDQSESINNTHEHSLNLNLAYNDSYRNSSSLNDENFSNLNTVKKIKRSETDHNNAINPMNFNIIFQIGTKIRNLKQPPNNLELKYDIPEKENINDFNNWEVLSEFLKKLITEFQADFLLEQKNRTLQFNMSCPRAYSNYFTKLINQYLIRNNIERSCMYLNWERRGTKIIDHLSAKFSTMNELTENPLELYEQLKLLTSEGKQVHSNELQLVREKLLMILYREGFGDNSLKLLKKIYDRAKKSFYKKKSKMGTNRKDIQYSIKIKKMFQYLYCYNNVFVSHTPKDLSKRIERYKEHIDRYNRIKNNQILFPLQQQNVIITHNETDQNLTQTDVSNSRTSSEKYTVPFISATQTLPLITTNTTVTSETSPSILSVNTSINSNFQISLPSSHCFNNSISQNDAQFVNSMKVNQAQSVLEDTNEQFEYSNQVHSTLQNNPLNKKNNNTNFKKKNKNFIKNTKKLLERAKQLDSPRLNKLVKMFENKIKHKALIEVHDHANFQLFQKLVEKEKNFLKNQYRRGKFNNC